MKVIDPSILEHLPTLDRWQRRLDVADLLSQADDLPPRDRLLLELVLRDGKTHREVAEAMAIPRGSVSRRVRRLLRRLHDPMVLALKSPTCPLAPGFREPALRVYRDRVSLQEVAGEFGITVTTLQRRLLFVRAWFRGLQQGPGYFAELSAAATASARQRLDSENPREEADHDLD